MNTPSAHLLSMGNDTATAPLATDSDTGFADVEIAALTESIAHLTGPGTGLDADAVIAALLPALSGIVDERCAADRAVVLAQVNAFRAKVKRSMVRVQRDADAHADALVNAL